MNLGNINNANGISRTQYIFAMTGTETNGPFTHWPGAAGQTSNDYFGKQLSFLPFLPYAVCALLY